MVPELETCPGERGKPCKATVFFRAGALLRMMGFSFAPGPFVAGERFRAEFSMNSSNACPGPGGSNGSASNMLFSIVRDLCSPFFKNKKITPWLPFDKSICRAKAYLADIAVFI